MGVYPDAQAPPTSLASTETGPEAAGPALGEERIDADDNWSPRLGPISGQSCRGLRRALRARDRWAHRGRTDRGGAAGRR